MLHKAGQSQLQESGHVEPSLNYDLGASRQNNTASEVLGGLKHPPAHVY